MSHGPELILEQSTDKDFKFRVTKDTGATQDLIGSTVTFYMKRHPSKADANATITKDNSSNGGLTLTDATTGIFTLTFADTDTSSLSLGKYYYKILATLSNGNIKNLVTGAVDLLQSKEPIYCSVVDVKTLLRTNNRGRLRTSEIFTNIQAGSGNTGDIALTATAIRIADNYAGQEKVTFTFTDATSFNAVLSTSEIGNISLGSGNILSNFNAVDPINGNTIFTINFTGWSGSGTLSDTISFETKSNISNDDLKHFIRLSEHYADNLIRTERMEPYDTTSGESLLFGNDFVPSGVRFACTYMSSFFITGAIFPQQNEGENDVKTWFDIGLEVLQRFASRPESLSNTGPRWLSRKLAFPDRKSEIDSQALNFLPNPFGVGVDINERFLTTSDSFPKIENGLRGMVFDLNISTGN